MKANCRKFSEWLERLPRQDLSPAFQEHLAECPYCSHEYYKLSSVVSVLSEDHNQIMPLSEITLSHLSEHAKNAARKQSAKSMIVRLSCIGILCLPVLTLINWIWASLGYSMLSTYLSPVAARVYLIVFLTIASALSGLTYASIPLLTGWLKGYNLKEY